MSCLAQGHNTVTAVRLDPTTPKSRVKHSTTALPDDCQWCVDNNVGFDCRNNLGVKCQGKNI